MHFPVADWRGHIGELRIPLPSVDVQQEIAGAMDSINVNIEQHQQVASTMQSLRDLIFRSLMQS